MESKWQKKKRPLPGTLKVSCTYQGVAFRAFDVSLLTVPQLMPDSRSPMTACGSLKPRGAHAGMHGLRDTGGVLNSKSRALSHNAVCTSTGLITLPLCTPILCRTISMLCSFPAKDIVSANLCNCFILTRFECQSKNTQVCLVISKK